MAQSLGAVYIHVVFSTKNRVPFLADLTLRADLHGVILGISRDLDCPSLQVGGVEDHVHLLARLHRTSSIADWVKEVKRRSSLWMKETVPELTDFAWQSGYGAFSVGYTQTAATTRYIANQVEHHRQHTYRDEYRRLLTLHGVEFDERYVWD
ncbi:MAG: IS200/IS605 family transposase [Hymenobacteraceae bacterium]|nr:IS200/IS605 family transposase [Hymenobacteraceae bacterium]